MFAQIGEDFMGNLYNRIHSLVLDKGMTDGSACAAVGLPRSTLGSLKTGKTKSLSQKNLKLFAELLNVTVDKLVNSEDSVDNLAVGVPLAMYDGNQYEQVPEDIKQLAAAFALAKKEQEIKDPALRKIIDVCKSNPEYIKPLSIMLDQLVSAVERKGGEEK
uniref:SOS-response transcriptional repressor n=1 Tax=Myoviridae sp. ctuev19 TaxID=2827716 RepID=A0A8S5SFF3_9CAUD|nr:MAG TPA: SOS-response transcriptional repressor [Myoviridae sp. ctuev19]